MSVQKNFSGAAEGSLTIRFSKPSDVPQVLKFYEDHRHPNVDHRGDDIFTDRTESGRALLVFTPDGAIGMSSMSHPMKGTGAVEIGSTLSPMEYRLYTFVIASQIIQEFLERTPEDRFFACIHKGNPVTDILHKKVGWEYLTTTQDFADSVGEGPNIDKLNWLHVPSNTLGHQARIVLDQIGKGYLEHKKTGERINLNLSGFSLATTFKRHVEELAGGRFGEMLEKSQPIPLKAARKALDDYQAGAQYFPQLSPKL
jgi:hypothetical protein